MTTWTLAVVAAQFWPTSAAGWIPVLGAALGAVAFAVSVYYALKIKPFVDQVVRWQPRGETPIALLAEVNAVGAKVSDLEKRGAQRDERFQTHDRQLGDHSRQLETALKAIGECTAWMQRVTEQQQDMREQILGHVSTATGKLTESMHEIDRTVAVLAEQVRHLREERE